MMEQRRHRAVEERIFGLVREYKPGALVMPLREFARDQMMRGYPREALVEDFEHVRSVLEDEDREREEDDVVTVMDALTGYISPAARL